MLAAPLGFYPGGVRVSGLEHATFVGFLLVVEVDALPIVFECPHCERVLVVYGAAVTRPGFVTCLACLRPMHQHADTVH